MANTHTNPIIDTRRILDAIENLIAADIMPNALNISLYVTQRGEPIGRVRISRDFSHLYLPKCENFLYNKIVTALYDIAAEGFIPSYCEVSRRVNISRTRLKRDYSELIDEVIKTNQNKFKSDFTNKLYKALNKLSVNNEYWLLSYKRISEEMNIKCSKTLKRHYSGLIEDYKNDLEVSCNKKLREAAFRLHFKEQRLTKVELLRQTGFLRNHIRFNQDIDDLIQHLNDRLKSKFHMKIRQKINIRKAKGLSINHHAIATDMQIHVSTLLRDKYANDLISKHT